MPVRIITQRFIKYSIIGLLFYSTGCSEIETKIEEGKVVSVKDGDTIEVLFNKKTITVRLAHIDCPERNQPFGTKAKQLTAELCYGQQIRLSGTREKDRYGRIIAEVINEKGDTVNRVLISKGLAWHFKKYSADSTYSHIEKIAHTAKIGLWQDTSAVAPWEWRNQKKIISSQEYYKAEIISYHSVLKLNYQ